MTTPGTASTSDARKRNAEKDQHAIDLKDELREWAGRHGVATGGVMSEAAVTEWLFLLGYPFELSWPSDPPPVDHRELAAIWRQRDDWEMGDEEAYLCVCEEAGIEP